MNIKYLVGTVIETLIKVVVLAVVIIFVFRTATKAYDFGYKVFADQPVSLSGGRTISVGVAEDASVKDIAKMLEEKGLIEDANLFVVQELLSAYHDKIIPGIYDLSTSMTAEQMLEVMSSTEETDETANPEGMATPMSDSEEDNLENAEEVNPNNAEEVIPEDTGEEIPEDLGTE